MKICITNQQKFSSHRCGWNYAIHALQPLHNPDGILFDGFLESNFLWQNAESKAVPYRQPWTGFLHYPPNMPEWFLYHDSPQSLFEKPEWKESLQHCVGLFCLSEYQAQWLRSQTGKPISALIHPTEIPSTQFNFDNFAANPNKKIVQLGWWLRKLNAIYQLPIEKDNPLSYEKVRLNPVSNAEAMKQVESLAEKEREIESISFDLKHLANTRELSRLTNQEYDKLLSENIPFVMLHDTSANNAVIECIARATPLLINPLPAVVEYLGKDYPLYANTLAEAADKAMDVRLIQCAHEYLKGCDTRQKMSADYFRQSFQDSEVYQLIEL